MSAVGPDSNFFIRQKSVGGEVSKDVGEIGGRSLHLSSTQTSGKEGAETEPLATRVWSRMVGLITWMWDCLKSLFIKATPESSKEMSKKELECPDDVIPESSKEMFKKGLECHAEVINAIDVIKDPHQEVKVKLRAFNDLLGVCSTFLSTGGAERGVCVEVLVRTVFNEFSPSCKKRVCRYLTLSETDQLKADSSQNLLKIRRELDAIDKKPPVFN